MALTRPTLNNILTNVVAFADPITVLHQGATNANVDVGFLFNRANGLVSNVAIYWSESSQSFITAFTANTGVTDSNITPTSYANLTIGNLLMVNGGILNVTGNINGNTAGTHYGNIVSTTANITTANITTANITTANVAGDAYVGGNLLVVGNITTLNREIVTSVEIVSGNLVANSGTASTSNVTGALIVTGGIGTTGNIYSGNLNIGGFSQSSLTITSTTGRTAIIGFNDTYNLDINPGTGYLTLGRFNNTGIGGNTSPQHKLSVAGDTYTSGNVIVLGNIIQTGTGYATIPVGTTAQRPVTATSGMIRYNSTLSSFEGYGSAWSSLGGVKSVDGNTYILAEATVGAGDNTLWFYNNATNTAKLTTANLTLLPTTAATSASTGALIVAGGIGIAKDSFFGANVTIYGNLTVSGNSVSIGASTLSINDPIINLNTPADLTPLTTPTTSDIGVKFHYYDTVDSAAFLGRTNADGYLTWYSRGTDTANVFTGTVYGTVKSGGLWLANTTSSTSKTTGALRVDGGVGVAGDVNIGTSLTVDGGAYGNVTTTQFGSVFATAYGPNNYSLLQAWSPATGGGLGLNAYGNVIYSSGAITFRTGAAIRDKDYPTGGTLGVQIASNGAIIASTGIASTSTGTGAVIVSGGAGISGALNTGANISIGGSTPGLITPAGTNSNLIIDPDGSGNVYISANTFVNYNSPSTSTTTGALVVTGGVGIAGNLNVGGNLITTGITTYNANVIVNGNLKLNGPLYDVNGNIGLSGQVLASFGTAGTQWITKNAGSLSVLTDVNLSAPAIQQVLTYNGTQWVNANASATIASAVFASSQYDMGAVNDNNIVVTEDEGTVTTIATTIYDLGVMSFTGVISLNNIDQSIKSDYLGYSIIFGF